MVSTTSQYFSRIVLVALVLSVCLIGVVHADTLLIYPPSAEGNTVCRAAPGDGSETLTEIVTGAGTDFYASDRESTWLYASATTNEWQEVDRPAYSVNTSAVPDGATITGIKIGIYSIAHAHNMDTPSIVITGFNPATNGTIAIADYNKYTNVLYSPLYTITSLETGAWYNLTGNAAFIANVSKTGYTNFMIRDYNETTLTNPGWTSGWENYIEYGGIAHSSTPLWIEITYTTDTGTTSAFSANVTSGATPLAVGFTDSSTGSPTNWDWYFGNGTKFSDSQHPTVVLTTGLHTINLYTNNSYGGDWQNKTNYINVTSGVVIPTASFSGTPLSGTVPLSVVFTDSSSNTPTSWNWSFGDGNYSDTQSPTHEYAYAGVFDVNLTATNVAGSDSELKSGYITAYTGDDPYAGFVPASITGAEPLTVYFQNLSYNGSTSWVWNKTDVEGDNVPITFSTAENPTHVFSQGNWSIQLNASNIYGANITPANIVFVNVTGGGVPPVASFTQDKSSIQQGEYVQFTDTSTGSPTSWNWEKCHWSYNAQHDIGACIGGWPSFATEQNPVYNGFVYAQGYTGYWIRMTATNAYGSDTEGGNGGGIGETSGHYHFVNVTATPTAPIADFSPEGIDDIITVERPTTIHFIDTSTHTPTSWNWTFQKTGGYIYSSEQNPYFWYDSTNATTDTSYVVILNASNSMGSSTKTRYVSVTTAPATPIARINVSNPTNYYFGSSSSPSSSVPVSNTTKNLLFTDASYNTPTSWVWKINAGNGTTYNYYTSSVNFTYTTTTAGYYSVQLNVTNDAGTDSLYFSGLAHVFDTTPPASISGIINTTGSATIKWNWTNPATDVSTIMVWKNGTWLENITYPQNGTTWTGLNPSTGYAIATKTVDASGNVNATFINSTAKTGVSQWTYNCSASTQYWTAPLGVTEITLDIGAGAGSGACSDMFMGWYYHGLGGDAGEFETVSRVSVVPGTTYSVTVGCGGPTTVYPETSHAGSNSRFEGGILVPIIKTGGLGGLKPSPRVAGNGTAGENGFLGVGNASWGYNGTYHSGGAPGVGWSAGGGGASGNQTEGGNGGKGSDGIVRITVYGTAGLNVPDFTADRTTGGPGTLIHFTDLSVISDPDQLTYNWTFGDGSYSSSTNPQHVYSYTGTYDVSLTVSNVNGSITETKPEYINIAQVEYPKTYYTQRMVRLKIVDGYGTPLEGAFVSVSYINSSLPSTDTSWLSSAFGIDETVAAEMVNGGLTMQAMTGSDGSAVFMMFPAIQYGITITNATVGLSKYVSLYPQDSDYVIYCTLTSQGRVTDRTTYLYNSSLYISEPNSSWITWNLLYQDTSGDTTSLTWNVTCWNNMTVMYTNTWPTPGTGVITDSYTFPSEPRGVEYRAMYVATRDI